MLGPVFRLSTRGTYDSRRTRNVLCAVLHQVATNPIEVINMASALMLAQRDMQGRILGDLRFMLHHFVQLQSAREEELPVPAAPPVNNEKLAGSERRPASASAPRPAAAVGRDVPAGQGHGAAPQIIRLLYVLTNRQVLADGGRRACRAAPSAGRSSPRRLSGSRARRVFWKRRSAARSGDSKCRETRRSGRGPPRAV